MKNNENRMCPPFYKGLHCLEMTIVRPFTKIEVYRAGGLFIVLA